MNQLLQQKSELPWTRNEAVIRIIIFYLAILTLLLSLQLALISFTVSIFRDDPNQNMLVANFLASLTGIIGILLTYIFLKIDKRNFHQIGWNFPSNTLLLTIVALIITPIALMIGFAIESLGEVINIDQMLTNRISDPIQIILRPFFVIMGIAIGEEIIFRGYLQRVLESQLNFWKATLVSAILFGLLHVVILSTNRIDVIPTMVAVGGSATVFGIMFSYAYKITGRNLFFPILIHGIWNSIIFYFNTQFIYDTPFKVGVEIFSQTIAALVLIGFIYVLKRYYIPKNKLDDWN